MLFNGYPFLIFFLAVLALSRSLPARHRPSMLLGASLLFYFAWIPQYLLLLLVDIGVNYALLLRMQKSQKPRRYVVASVLFSLGILGAFKYAAFLAGSFDALFGLGGGDFSDVFLPLGISFYTFQILALTIDVQRGVSPAPKDLREYALFVCFFPQLIAGPILRGSELLPQLRTGGTSTRERSRRGLWLIGAGLAKKVLLADLLLAPFADRVFSAPGLASAPEHLFALYSFAFQIYFDFSGYTDIARGVALLLGFELPLNFREPYLSRNPAEFWRRWHITLSRWLRDYLYIPLGGNRSGANRTGANLLITMLLGGLWHGAGWNFVIWGGLHGVLLGAHRLWRGREPVRERPLRLADAPRILLFFHATCFLWIFFRAPDFSSASAFVGRLMSFEYGADWPVMQAIVVGVCVGLHGLERLARLHVVALRARLSGLGGAAVEGLVLGTIAGLVALFGGTGGEFIYFQF